MNGSGWAPDTFQDGDTNIQQEKTYAAFGLLRFGHELGSMTLDGNVGVRVVRTDYTASGSARQPDWTSHPLLNNNGDPDFVAKYGSGEWLPNHFEDSYQDVLPSLNLRLKLTDDLQLRFAASKAIARPSLDQLTANVTLGGDILRHRRTERNAGDRCRGGDRVHGQRRQSAAQADGGHPVRRVDRVVLRPAGLAVRRRSSTRT